MTSNLLNKPPTVSPPTRPMALSTGDAICLQRGLPPKKPTPPHHIERDADPSSPGSSSHAIADNRPPSSPSPSVPRRLPAADPRQSTSMPKSTTMFLTTKADVSDIRRPSCNLGMKQTLEAS
ncbi:hypothetical protein CSUB01_00505 [Colletotrichum sublineola]|uniref:Uncharacterized protein n=1 Tax=Colletotrichum sublineola TaxID=1173701 RepID=A0A066WY93_COLSU|nr:hypothetical protein CSUB01_00505 [Colletotrichum sublineola]